MALEDRIHGLAARYIAAPQWVKSFIGSAYAALPARVRLGSAYERFLRLFDSPPPYSGYNRMRLQETLTHALQTVPAYAKYAHLVAKVAEDPVGVLLQLPLTDKEAIKLRPEDYLSADAGSGRLRMFTGGSTAIPMTFFLTPGISRAKEWAAFRSLARRYGTDGQGVVLALRGRTVGTAKSGGRLWSYEPIKRHLIMSSDHLEARYMAEYVEAIRQWRPRHIHAFPSALYPLVRWLSENGEGELLAQIQGVLLTSESVFPYQLDLFRNFFRCPVIVQYGHTERVLFAHTLPDDPRYLFWPHYGHFELIDAKGLPVSKPGEMGEIVGTSFDNQVMPLVRYRTGDYAVLSEQPAPPGFEGFPVCERIEGRLQEFVVCRDRRLISVTTLGAAHFEQLERCIRIQYEQRTEGELLLRVVPLPGREDVDTGHIAAAVVAKTQGGCSVVVEVVPDISLTARGKQRLLLQHLDISNFLGASAEEGGPLHGTVGIPAPITEAAPAKLMSRLPSLSDAGGGSIVMVGTDPDMRGGIASVISTYRAAGFFSSGAIEYVPSHVDTSRWNKLATFFLALSIIFSRLARGRVVGVHAHVASKASFWRKSIILALARMFGAKTIFHLHGGGFDHFTEERCGSIAKRWIRHTLQASDGVIVLSKRWEDWIRRFAPRAKTLVLGNPISIPAAINGGARLMEVVFVGQICDAKGCFDLLKAFSLSRARYPEWRLVVAGNGEVERFKSEVAKEGLSEYVDFRGWIGSADKSALLNAASIYVLPSYAEGLPMGMLEAMSHGLPVVVTGVGGIPDTITDHLDGLIVSPGDIDGLVEALERLMHNPDLRKAIGNAGRQTAEQFSMDRITSRLTTIYAEVGFLVSRIES